MPIDRIALEAFQKRLMKVCARDTSFDGEGWSPKNPLWGHCAVATLLAQELFGGQIVRTLLDDTPFAAMGSHYALKIDGEIFDPTAPQFEDQYPANRQWKSTTSKDASITPEYFLNNENTRKRFNLLKSRYQAL